MAKRSRRRPLPEGCFPITIDNLSHDGRGVGRVEGKAVFVQGALPGERVEFEYLERRKDFDIGLCVEVLEACADRVEPGCAHFNLCGGCSLQHMSPEAQIAAKQTQLLSNFAHLGKVTPAEILPPLTGPHWGYRRKARMGVRYVIKKEKMLVGFREKRSGYLAELEQCPVLHPRIGEHLQELAGLLASLEAYLRIPQLEVAVDDTRAAIVVRNLDPLSEVDAQRLRDYAEQSGNAIFLQPGGPDTVAPLWPEQVELAYTLPAYDLRMVFEPTDFTQVNLDINRAMLDHALGLLDPQPGERILDLFCGLGNFTLPLARRASAVVGVEGDAGLIERARANAARNGISNAEFHCADLAKELEGASWWSKGFDKVLLDPARSGALEALPYIARLGVKRIVYVSCNPATLARDAGELVHTHGYRLLKAGVMDMFPHTAHVESIALFEKA